VLSDSRDAEFTEYVEARLPAWRRLAMLLCQDWQRADDVVQATITKLYVHWGRARAADNIDAYVRTILAREFLHEQRSGWARRVSLPGVLPETPTAAGDQDAALDLHTAVAALAPRQRAALVLRYYCDLNVDQSARVLGCSPGTVKSQTARALDALRRAMRPEHAASQRGADPDRSGFEGMPEHG
jgi:RNA polymerase sigma-70 factor (sigma-E family)